VDPERLSPSPAVRSATPGVAWPAVPDAAGAALLALLGQLEDTQWWPEPRLRAAQDRQLALVLDHARAHVPAYAQRLAGLDLSASALAAGAFEAIPPLTRAQVQDAGAALHSRALPAGHGARLALPTSGSTGRPLTAYGTGLTQLLAGAVNLRDHRWHRREVTARFAAIRTKVEPAAQDGWGGAPQAAWQTGPAATFPISRPLDEQLDWLLAQRPAYLITHPSNLAGLLALSARRGVRPEGLREVLSFGEALDPALRARCRRDWGAPLTDRYTCEEASYLALECPDAPGQYHVQAEHVRVEVLDDAGAPCPPGVPGRVALTTLHNYAMPLVRYLIGDWAAAGPPCACGRGLPVLTRIYGRVRSLVRLPDGRRHWPSFPAEDWLAIAPVRQFQLRQHAPDAITARVAADAPLAAAQREALAAMLRARLGHPFAIAFEQVDEIPAGPGAKYEDFVCELPEADA
jgi:phenylacetate-CoA ligase